MLATDMTLCVLTHGSHPGWIPTSAFEQLHRADIEKVQHRLDHQIDEQRHAAADREHDGKASTIVATEAPSNIDKLFTKPFQQAATSNHAHDYYVRGGSHVNLLVNLPTWDKHGSSIDERLGLAADIVAVGATFHQLSETANVHCIITIATSRLATSRSSMAMW